MMNDTIIHRGPDDEGLWSDPSRGVYLGFRRLSIIDIAGGKQPMWTSDGEIGIIFNGEIYNHEELRRALEGRGHAFQTDHSDTEVLLYGYREWGKELPPRLNGMWAFAIIDRRNNKLFISRDRFGKKPLFYALQNGTFAFSSELSSLVKHPRVSTSVSTTGLKKYFAYGFIPAPHSIYENIYKLPGGYNLTLDVGSLTYQLLQYWDFVIEPFENIPPNPEEVWGEELRDLLDKAVKRRLMSDVPLGVFLSGGIDSSSVTAYASKHVGSHRLKTFSIGFDEGSFDESVPSRKIASLFGTDHHLEMLSIETARTLLPEIVSRLDEPMGDSSLLPTYLLCKETRKYVTVAVGGDGADELFAGYDPLRALRFAKVYNSLVPKPVHTAIALAVARFPTSHKNMSLDFKIKKTLRGLSYPQELWNPVWLGPLEPKDLDELFQEPTNIEEVYSEAIDQWERCKQTNLVDRTLQFYTKLYLQDDILVKVDRASMLNSLEVRAPYLDIDLVNLVRRIPHQYKIRRGETKYILKRALEKVLPPETLYRSKKGFGVPIGLWFREGQLTLEGATSFSALNQVFIRNGISMHRNNRVDNRLFLWNLWLLSAWQSNLGIQQTNAKVATLA